MKFSSESFLQSFHRKFPSCTSHAFSAGLTKSGQTSYGLLVDLLKGQQGPLLDIACGDGYLLDLYAKDRNSNTELFGIDMSDGELEVAWKLKSLRPQNILKGNARLLPFAPGSFQNITCHMAFMLMPQVNEIIAEIYRTLQVGGSFAAIIPGTRLKDEPTNIYRNWLSAHLSVEELSSLKGLGDPRVAAPEELKELFKDFKEFHLEPFDLVHHLTPEQMTHYFVTLYATGLLNEEQERKLINDLLAAYKDLKQDKITYTYQVLRLTARK